MRGSKTAKVYSEIMLLLRIGFKKVTQFSYEDFDNHEKYMTKRRQDYSQKSLNFNTVSSALKAWRHFIYIYYIYNIILYIYVLACAVALLAI